MPPLIVSPQGKRGAASRLFPQLTKGGSSSSTSGTIRTSSPRGRHLSTGRIRTRPNLFHSRFAPSISSTSGPRPSLLVHEHVVVPTGRRADGRGGTNNCVENAVVRRQQHRRGFATDTTTGVSPPTTSSAVAASGDHVGIPEIPEILVEHRVFTPGTTSTTSVGGSSDQLLEQDVVDLPDLADTGLDYPLGSSADIIMERCIDQAAYYNYNMGEVGRFLQLKHDLPSTTTCPVVAVNAKNYMKVVPPFDRPRTINLPPILHRSASRGG